MKIDYKFKISLIGESNVGKTSLILRYVKNYFKEDLKSTIGTNFLLKQLDIDNQAIQLTIYDIGAQKIFSSMRMKYYQGSAASIAVFDLTSIGSLRALPEWISSVRDVCGNIPILMVGNKADLVSQRVISRQEAEAVASRFTCMYEEVSAKSGENVESMFELITRSCLELIARE
jgi:small GTP-binding protein